MYRHNGKIFLLIQVLFFSFASPKGTSFDVDDMQMSNFKNVS